MNDSSNLVLGKTVDSSPALVQFTWVGLFAVGTMLSARLEIPHQPVPYTLQTLMVLLSGAFLGPRNGMLSQLAYITAGILGAPVFAGGAAGFARILGPSGGYILSFPLPRPWWDTLSTGGTRSYRWRSRWLQGWLWCSHWAHCTSASSTRTASARPSRPAC